MRKGDKDCAIVLFYELGKFFTRVTLTRLKNEATLNSEKESGSLLS